VGLPQTIRASLLLKSRGVQPQRTPRDVLHFVA